MKFSSEFLSISSINWWLKLNLEDIIREHSLENFLLRLKLLNYLKVNDTALLMKHLELESLKVLICALLFLRIFFQFSNRTFGA